MSTPSAFAQGLADLFRRDLTRLLEELAAFPDDASFWKVMPGVTNPAGNLVLHIEGNLRGYVGRNLGGVPYERNRPLEFSAKDYSGKDLIARVENLREFIPGVIGAMSKEALDAEYPENIIGVPASSRQCLMSLYAHLSYHTGQIDYLRRIVTNGAPLKFTTLK
jgi:hypothetical protein